MKFISLGTIFLLLFGGIYYYRTEAHRQSLLLETYKNNTEILLSRLRRIYDEKIKLEQQKYVLEAAAKNDKNMFDWNIDISRTHVIRRLQQKQL
ncbi:MAG: hypothetical protein IJ864_00730 [Alphaproteobacteria bacterium]|nr:hypothetical protein [Alphaproteobacteria bacterium]